jgi:hypothetical protein
MRSVVRCLWSGWRNISKLGECQCRNISSQTMKRVEAFINMMTDTKHFYSMFLKEKCLWSMLGLRNCTLLCKDAEYKNMDQDMSLGQLYNVQNKITILTKQKLGLLFSYYTLIKNVKRLNEVCKKFRSL